MVELSAAGAVVGEFVVCRPRLSQECWLGVVLGRPGAGWGFRFLDVVAARSYEEAHALPIPLEAPVPAGSSTTRVH